jgi:CRISPR-associated protein Csc3
MTQLSESTIADILTEYMEKFVPAMLLWRYHLILVKGGPEPEYSHLSEQSHFAHIINGVFGLAELVSFIAKNRVFTPDLDEDTFRKALALFTVHEVHKARDYEKIGTSEFSIPLERLLEEYERLGLSSFAVVDDYLMRSGNVHKRSPQHGDVLLSEDEAGSFLWLLVRIADTFASVQTPEEAASSLAGYLKRLGPTFAPKSPSGKYALYYHAIKDVRGVLTNTLHEAVSRKLENGLGFYSLLFFPTGTLYLGPSTLEPLRRDEFIQGVIAETLGSLREYGDSSDAIREGQRASYFDYETFVYSFAEVPALLELIRDDTIAAKIKVQDIVGEGCFR